MRFILLRDTAQGALLATADSGAQLLRPGQLLHWPGLAPRTCFVIPLLAQPQSAPAPLEAAPESV